MGSADARKLCVRCGADVTDQQRHKNRRGEYLCIPCHQATRHSQHSPPASESSRRCVCCGVQVTRQECHKNRYGEHICLTCHRAGRHRSRRRSVQQALKRCFRVVFYVLFAALGMWIAFQVFAKVMGHLQSTE